MAVIVSVLKKLIRKTKHIFSKIILLNLVKSFDSINCGIINFVAVMIDISKSEKSQET
jgi:hypothetical protein